jgi:hypothetical protein
MLHDLIGLLSGVLVAPIGAVACVLLVYAVLALAGRDEDQGRRGLLAGVIGIIPGAVIGFLVGLSLASADPASPNAWIAHFGAALLDAIAVGAIGWIVGNHRAEARGMGETPCERSTWSLFYVALPLALTNGVGLFLAMHVVTQ